MSRLQIDPPVATVYPGDEQIFTVKAVPPPVLWRDVTDSGDIKSDFSLEVDGAGSSTSANSGHQLHSGIGIVEFTINDQCRPTSTGFFQFIGFIREEQGFDYAYQVVIEPNAVKVNNESAVQIYNEVYSTVSGDIYRLELVAGFRLYRNGVLLHSRVDLPTLVVFPHLYSVFIAEPTATAPTRVPPPRLIGDWRVAPDIVWSAPSHGTLTPSSDTLQAEYSGGTLPGTYTVTAAMEPSADPDGLQRATATAIIPPLEHLGPDDVTLAPGQKVRFKTNYNAAQNPLVTWSIVSGSGSFTDGEFAAPTAPGTTVVRATALINKQVANITVTVPAVITPAVTGAAPSDVVELATNLTDPIWTATDGIINNAGLWRVPQGTDRKVRITAASNGLTATRDIEILEKFPLANPSAPITVEHQKNVLISTAEDRTRTSRVKDLGGLSFQSREVTFKNVELEELEQAIESWEKHYPGKKIIIEDNIRGARLVCYFDSNLRWEAASDCSIDISFRIREA